MKAGTVANGTGKLRIIGGKWRGRKLSVPVSPQLRPTPDRARETLFNWLQPVITGACCLDLFAGTGVLGFEALSRGAARVVMVESNAHLVKLLHEQRRKLGTDSAEIMCASALEWLQSNSDCFNIVFLDPPFRESLLETICAALVKGEHLQPGALVYMESEPGPTSGAGDFKVIKQSRAGQVQYRLVEYTRGNSNK